jgi:hypothetical protein
MAWYPDLFWQETRNPGIGTEAFLPQENTRNTKTENRGFDSESILDWSLSSLCSFVAKIPCAFAYAQV